MKGRLLKGICAWQIDKFFSIQWDAHRPSIPEVAMRIDSSRFWNSGPGDEPATTISRFWTVWLRWTLTGDSSRTFENEDSVGIPYLASDPCFDLPLQSHPPHALQSPPCNRSSTHQILDAVAGIRTLDLGIRDSYINHYTTIAQKFENWMYIRIAYASAPGKSFA